MTVFPDSGVADPEKRTSKSKTPDRGSINRGKPLLEIIDLDVAFRSGDGEVPAVRQANLTVYPGQTVAIVGESGSGKSTTALAVIGLLPSNGRVTGGEIKFDGKDIAHANKKEIIALRGDSIGLVPQDPMTNLNPVWKIGSQIVEALSANGLGRGRPATMPPRRVGCACRMWPTTAW